MRRWIIAFTFALVLAFIWKFSDRKEVSTHHDTPSAADPLKQDHSTPLTSSVPTAIKPSALHNLSAQDQILFATYKEIRDSKNDNDPRLDQDLKHLSQDLHRALIEDYAQMPAEKRNERGLVTFIIARDANSVEDLQFLTSVYEESPCASFDNCSVPQRMDPHLGGIEETSLNYPQVAGLFQLQVRLSKEDANSFLKDEAKKAQLRKLLEAAEQFPSPAIQGRAQNLRDQISL